MSIVAILQARASSSRLPNKVLKPILGKPMLQHQIERVCRSQLIDQLVVATSDETSDDVLAQLLAEWGVSVYRGSLNDVLDRFYNAANQYQPTHVVRLTGDCPLIDHKVIDKVIFEHVQSGVDYTSNSCPPSYPDGLDVEVVRYSILKKAWKAASLPSEREHVTSYIRRPEYKFKILNVTNDIDLAKLRWTVDEPDDFRFVEEVYLRLFPSNHDFLMNDVLRLLEREPELIKINSNYVRNEGYQQSLKKDGLPPL